MTFTAPISETCSCQLLRTNVLNFTKTSQEMREVWVQIRVCPYVKHTCHWADFHLTRLVWPFTIRKSYSEFHENVISSLVADTISQSDKSIFFTSYRTRNKTSCPVRSHLLQRLRYPEPISVATPSKSWVCDCPLGGIVSWNPAGGTDACLWFVCCQVEVSAMDRSLVQGSPTKCSVSECDFETSAMKRPWSTRAVEPAGVGEVS
jgi:hypothetical protein